MTTEPTHPQSTGSGASRRSFLSGTLALGTAGGVSAALAATPAAFAATPAAFAGTPAADAATGQPVTFWVAPDGNDANAGTRTQPFRTLAQAQRAVRAVQRRMDVTVYLAGGTYELAETLRFDAADGGQGGRRVEYRAAKGATPVLSGGLSVTGWQLHDQTKNIWRAPLRSETEAGFRQLWVDGKRAVRARSGFQPGGFELTETGYVYRGGQLDFTGWRNLREVEIVSFRRWRSFRTRISTAATTADGIRLEMQNPGWALAYENHRPWGNITLPVWVENAYELLDTEGEWYFDRPAGFLYYKPRAGEDIRTAVAIVGNLQTILEVRGELGAPVRDLHFEGLTFAHGTWLGPNSENGFAVIQAGYHRTSAASAWDKMPANVTVQAAEGIRFHRCRFEHLGGSGLELEIGTKRASINGSLFQDISGNAIQVSGVDEIHHHPADERAIVFGNRITDNYVTDAATEYHGCVGIWVGYADTTTIHHNTLARLPYTAISVGWGWGTVDPGGSSGYTTPTTCRNNSISFNHIHHFTEQLIDGGGIYTLSAQAGSEIRGNFIHDQVVNHYDDSLVYLDEATQHYVVRDNVLCSTPRWWLKIWTASIRNNQATQNFIDRPDAVWNNGVDNVVENNPLMDAAIPARAVEVAAAAGMSPEYRSHYGVPAPPQVSAVRDPQYAGRPPLGPPWTP